MQRLARALLHGLYRQISALPPPRAEQLARLTVALTAPALAGRQRANFGKLFPRLEPQEIRALCARHARYLARLRVHAARFGHQPPEVLRNEINWRGEEHLNTALAAGRGTLVVGAHSGTWWHAPIGIALTGRRVSCLVNPDITPAYASYLQRIAARFGMTLLFVHQDAYGAVRAAFQRNEICFATMDYSLRPERSLWPSLCGARLAVDPGLAILALRQRPAVLWGTCFHDESGRSTVELSPPMAIGRGTPLATPEALSLEWVARLQKQLTQRPEQWWIASFCSLADAATLPSTPSVELDELKR